MKVLAICILAVIMIGCKGETGPTGPQGNANVKSRLYSIWQTNYTLKSGIFISTNVCDIITHDIIQSGAVLVYNTNFTSNVTLPYPYTFTYDDSRGYTFSYIYSFQEGYINFMFIDSNPNSNTIDDSAIGHFRVIAISGNTSILKYIDKSDYGAVKTALNITD